MHTCTSRSSLIKYLISHSVFVICECDLTSASVLIGEPEADAYAFTHLMSVMRVDQAEDIPQHSVWKKSCNLASVISSVRYYYDEMRVYEILSVKVNTSGKHLNWTSSRIYVNFSIANVDYTVENIIYIRPTLNIISSIGDRSPMFIICIESLLRMNAHRTINTNYERASVKYGSLASRVRMMRMLGYAIDHILPSLLACVAHNRPRRLTEWEAHERLWKDRTHQ